MEPTRLRAGDRLWDHFLSRDERLDCAVCDAEDPINILFSSGTTGEPKAIPWDHTTPIKCAADAHFHHDLHPGDVACWPTNLGWMMGPWLIFATLLNRATMALYGQAPHGCAASGSSCRTLVSPCSASCPACFAPGDTSECMHGLDWSRDPSVQLDWRMLQCCRHALLDAPGRLPPHHRILRWHGDRRRLCDFDRRAADRSGDVHHPGARNRLRPSRRRRPAGDDGRSVLGWSVDRAFQASAQSRSRRGVLQRHSGWPRRSAVAAAW